MPASSSSSTSRFGATEGSATATLRARSFRSANSGCSSPCPCSFRAPRLHGLRDRPRVPLLAVTLFFSTTLDGLMLFIPLFVYGIGVGFATAQLTSIVLLDVPLE